MAPVRIQLSRRKGWRMPPNTVKVDRSTRWGNPFVLGVHGDREECFEMHRRLLEDGIVAAKDADAATMRAYRDMVRARIGELRGRNLACWCHAGQPCHADTLLRLANGPERKTPPDAA